MLIEKKCQNDVQEQRERRHESGGVLQVTLGFILEIH